MPVPQLRVPGTDGAARAIGVMDGHRLLTGSAVKLLCAARDRSVTASLVRTGDVATAGDSEETARGGHFERVGTSRGGRRL
ncbi:hypothetical protein SBRY_60548 [Actinacidiphila bryophytorum]|uniref:Uncharacterized protein n=1 Tax=Actinacidiphila bryophytorum TaxID=1436133 RepID=A0A9W4MKA8_9ACTN|nr:hypothetical protein SBRY_60548 [Actinacidiphila bryophytorum]